MNRDGLTRLVLRGVISQLREATNMSYRVPMKALSDAYAPDYVESMIMKKDIDKVIKELEKAVSDDDSI